VAIVGDPEFGEVDVATLLEPGFLKTRAARINPDRSLEDPLPDDLPPGVSRPSCEKTQRPPKPSTSEISIVDNAGNALAMTTTINVNFGSWIAVGGFFLNDAMTNFAFPTDRGCPANAPAGGKRAETAMAPIMAMDENDEVFVVGGSAGAVEIVDYVGQAVLELLAGRSPTQALDEGHISTAFAPYSESPGLVELEQGRAIAQFAEPLRALGHKVKIAPLPSGTAFLVRRSGRWEGAADPRRDGSFAAAP
jgi:gamma-glutamyltranspeptidase/glutathione hydrolase